MKQTLQLKIGQHLTMTPQLQQAIRLLQLSTLELQTEIQEALDNNPLLEIAEEDSLETAPEQTQQDAHSTASESNPDSDTQAPLTEAEDNSAANDSDWIEDIPENLSTDSSWDDTYQSSSISTNARDDDWVPGDNDSRDETLQDHLLWQLNLTPMSEADQLIAEAIIDAIDTEGYLTSSTEELLTQCQEQYSDLFGDYEVDEIDAVLRRIQQFDPAGVAARNLSECLILQLKQLPVDTPRRPEALRLCRDYLALLGSHDYKSIMRRMRIKEGPLQEVISLIQNLNPRPGSMLNRSESEYVVPDVIVRKVSDDWVVSLNNDISPELRINQQYASLIKRADSSPDNQFLKTHLQDARWFIKSLQSRNDTLLKVASQIVARQTEFLEIGEEGMHPMVLHDIAEAVDMHESTISRVTTQKYMHTPRGVFELKYFFSSQVSTSDGGSASSTAIRALIKKLVGDENTKKPLSDNKIAQLLEEQGINVARRTVAKYREVLGIPPSNERKRLV